MKHCKPIIATDTDFFSEELENGKDAVLVEWGDKEDLARGIREIVTDANLRRRMSAELSFKRSLQSWDKVALSHATCYKGLVMGAT